MRPLIDQAVDELTASMQHGKQQAVAAAHAVIRKKCCEMGDDYCTHAGPCASSPFASVQTKAAANAVSPPHYQAHPSGVECITITEHMNFNLGNAVKYIWRAGLKGNQIEDLQKARWYLDREIARLDGLAGR